MATQHCKDKQDVEMLNYAATAQLTGLPLGTLYALVHRRQIPHIRLGPRLVRFLRADLLRWIEDRRVPIQHTYALRAEASGEPRPRRRRSRRQ